MLLNAVLKMWKINKLYQTISKRVWQGISNPPDYMKEPTPCIVVVETMTIHYERYFGRAYLKSHG